MGNPSIVDRVRAYEEWLMLADYLSKRFSIEWPKNELRAYVSYDEVLVSWELGSVGKVYRQNQLCVFSSFGREKLRAVDPDDAQYVFHEHLLPYLGWQSDERVRSDIDYSFRHFWKTALDEARIAWRADTVTTDAMDRLKNTKRGSQC